jgi:prepilin-type N-terminal cleavage/methylation domain-containing protein
MTANLGPQRLAFTLVELLVALIIVSILAALTLSGLATVRRRAKEDATRTTIRKIHEIIVPMYEGYLDKRVPAGVGTGSINQLIGNRRRLAYEMPDNWNDVGPSPATVPAVFDNGRTRAYAAYKGSPSPSYGSAECLYMICTLSGYEPEAMENFRAAEIGDADGDGKPEFHDSWGSPIAFIRWPTGFAGPVTLNQTADPFDPNVADTSLSSPPVPSFAYGTVPLIYSAGLDKEYGLNVSQQISGEPNAVVGNFDDLTTTSDGHFASPLAGGDSVDNISNHDLVTR